MSKNNYYVYAYLRNSDSSTANAGTPYYIGKGIGKRAFSKTHRVAVPDNQKNIVFVETNLTNIGALALERRLIRWYGRKDLGNGILRNLSDGGDGTAGFSHSEETKRKMRKPKSTSHILSMKKPKSAEHAQNIRLARRSDESRAKVSKLFKGIPKTKEHVEKVRLALSGKTRSDTAKKNISNGHIGQVAWNKGKKMTDDWKANRPWHTCSICGIQSQNLTNIKRYHNDNCKQVKK
jgi:hypothetical protein